VLRAHAEKKAPDGVRFNHELVALEQDADCVTSRVVDKDTSTEYLVRSRYVLGCDGGRTVGGLLGIQLEGQRNIAYTVTVHMTADLSPWARDPDVLIRWLWAPHVGRLAVLVPMGPDHWGPHSEEWVFHLNYPAADQRIWDDAAMIRDMKDLLGLPELDPVVHRVTRWSFEALVAQRFRLGRVFLLGDAAHRHGPTGGLGLTSAVQDAANLCWKVAAVLAGRAGDALLDTYEMERRPVDARNVQRSTENVMNHLAIGQALGLNPEAPAEMNWANMRRMWSTAPEDVAHRHTVLTAVAAQSMEFRQHNVESGYTYASDAVVPDGTPEVASLDGIRLYQPGTRPGAPLPHAWVEDDRGERCALLDLARPGEFLLIAGEDGEAWCAAARAVSADLEVPLAAVRIGHVEGDYRDIRLAWLQHREVTSRGAVLVRPDNFVGWRSFGVVSDPEGELRRALQHLLARGAVAAAPDEHLALAR